MGIPRYQLIYREKATRGPALRQTCDAEKQIDVIEISTRQRLHLCARDLSIYRHTLVIENTPYDILNVSQVK